MHVHLNIPVTFGFTLEFVSWYFWLFLFFSGFRFGPGETIKMRLVHFECGFRMARHVQFNLTSTSDVLKPVAEVTLFLFDNWSTSTTRTNHTASHTTSHTTNHTAFLKLLGGGNGLLYDFSRSKSDLYNIWTCTDVAAATDLLYEPHRASMSLIDKSVKWRRVTANHTAIIQLLTLSRFHRVIYYVFIIS